MHKGLGFNPSPPRDRPNFVVFYYKQEVLNSYPGSHVNLSLIEIGSPENFQVITLTFYDIYFKVRCLCHKY